jgi:hypothetical protein
MPARLSRAVGEHDSDDLEEVPCLIARFAVAIEWADGPLLELARSGGWRAGLGGSPRHVAF